MKLIVAIEDISLLKLLAGAGSASFLSFLASAHSATLEENDMQQLVSQGEQRQTDFLVMKRDRDVVVGDPAIWALYAQHLATTLKT